MHKSLIPLGGMIALFIACGSPQTPTSKEPVVLVKTARVKKTEGKLTKSWPAKIESPYIIELGFTVPGRVESVNVAEGKRVQKGDILATLEKDAAQNTKKLALIEVARAQDLLTMSKKLRSTGSIAERDYNDNLFQYEQAVARAQVAESELKQTSLLAPFDGIIVNSYLNRGSIVAPGTKVFTFMRSDGLRAVMEVHASDLPDIKKGSECIITLPNNNSVSGIVAFISPLADNYNKTTIVKISLNQQSVELYPGMFVNVQSDFPSQKFILLNKEALHIDNDQSVFVYVVKDSTVEKRKISLKSYEKIDDLLIVTNGLAENDEVVIAGAENLSEKQKVKITN